MAQHNSLKLQKIEILMKSETRKSFNLNYKIFSD